MDVNIGHKRIKCTLSPVDQGDWTLQTSLTIHFLDGMPYFYSISLQLGFNTIRFLKVLTDFALN